MEVVRRSAAENRRSDSAEIVYALERHYAVAGRDEEKLMLELLRTLKARLHMAA
jgi:hypothetical protein